MISCCKEACQSLSLIFQDDCYKRGIEPDELYEVYRKCALELPSAPTQQRASAGYNEACRTIVSDTAFTQVAFPFAVFWVNKSEIRAHRQSTDSLARRRIYSCSNGNSWPNLPSPPSLAMLWQWPTARHLISITLPRQPIYCTSPLGQVHYLLSRATRMNSKPC